MIKPEQDYLLFDGDCGICSYCSDVAAQMDQAHRFVIEPYQSVPEIELQRFGITYQDCDTKVQVITRRGRVHAGAFAVNYFLWQRPVWRLLVFTIYALPVLLVCEIIGYAIVARNRQRLSRWFGLKACLLRR
jgi:predicted DCC family thiol-disulfide oxidoreductase YuxK